MTIHRLEAVRRSPSSSPSSPIADDRALLRGLIDNLQLLMIHRPKQFRMIAFVMSALVRPVRAWLHFTH